MTAKKMADIFFGKFSELISKDKNLPFEKITKENEQISTDQVKDNKKPNQKIIIYSAIVLTGAFLIFAFF